MAVAFDPSAKKTTEPLPETKPSAMGFINRTAQTFFSKVEERRYAEGKNFFYFTPTLLPLFGMLYGGAPEGVKEDLQAFLHDDGSCNVHEAFGNWLKKEYKSPELFIAPIAWIIEKVSHLQLGCFLAIFLRLFLGKQKQTPESSLVIEKEQPSPKKQVRLYPIIVKNP